MREQKHIYYILRNEKGEKLMNKLIAHKGHRFYRSEETPIDVIDLHPDVITRPARIVDNGYWGDVYVASANVGQVEKTDFITRCLSEDFVTYVYASQLESGYELILEIIETID